MHDSFLVGTSFLALSEKKGKSTSVADVPRISDKSPRRSSV